MTFQLDTTGAVGPYRSTDLVSTYALSWSDLDAFTQGYVEALFQSVQVDALGATYAERPSLSPAFSDLAPETLARIIADCAVSAAQPTTGEPRGEGAAFWRLRNACDYVGFPPLNVQLGDDGKVRFA